MDGWVVCNVEVERKGQFICQNFNNNYLCPSNKRGFRKYLAIYAMHRNILKVRKVHEYQCGLCYQHYPVERKRKRGEE
jgi:hypothetical protein